MTATMTETATRKETDAHVPDEVRAAQAELADSGCAAHFPTTDGVEIRTMGPHYRPIRLYVGLHTAFSAHDDRTRRNTLTGKMFAVDTEAGDELIPNLRRLTLDPTLGPGSLSGRSGILTGRLVRLTFDSIIPIKRDFSCGYHRAFLPGTPERLVSEPFMLFGIVTLGESEFDKQRARADEEFHRVNRMSTRGVWD